MSGLYNFLANLLYHHFAWTYDWVAAFVSAGMWRSWVLSVVPDLTGPRVLELGHGPGYLQAALLEEGLAAFGIDRSPQMGRQARRRLESCQLSPSLTRSLAQRIPFPGRVFDQVVATFPTEYIVHPDTLAEIFRVLRPGGSLIILPAATITQPKSGRERFGAWLFRATGQIVKKDKRFQVQMEDPIRQAGFQIETRQRPFKSSTIFIILAQKPSITHLTT